MFLYSYTQHNTTQHNTTHQTSILSLLAGSIIHFSSLPYIKQPPDNKKPLKGILQTTTLVIQHNTTPTVEQPFNREKIHENPQNPQTPETPETRTMTGFQTLI